MDSVINEHCTAIFNQGQTIPFEQLRSLFDLILIELNKYNNSPTHVYVKIINTLKNISGSTLIGPSIVTHELFHLIRNLLTDILKNWSGELILTDKDEYLFQEIVELFSKMIQQLRAANQVLSSPFQTWFLTESFFRAIASTLDDISKNSHKYVNQDHNMKSLMSLIQSIRYFQRGLDPIRNNPNVLLLIDPIIHCLCSSSYTNTLKKIPLKSTNQTPYEEFLLETCPCYCVWYRGKSQLHIINQLCLNHMLQSYQEVYELFLPTIDQWECTVTEAIFYMTALLRYVAYYPSTREYLKENLKILDSILIILGNNVLLDNVLITTDYNSQTNITDSAISFIFNLTHDCQFLTLIKDNEHFSKGIFLKLKDVKVDRVKLHAFMILAKILNEQDIQKLDRIDTLITVFINYLFKAVNDPCHSFQDVPVEHLLISLKAFIQHDEVKDEIAKQNYFEFFIRCATQTDLHVGLVLQTALEIIWSLTFNKKIHRILLDTYDNFIRYLKTVLINSNEQGVQAAAQGILWKLENESIHTKQILDKNETKNSHEDKYDMMISYSHSNKDLCLQIYQNLTKLNYRVWLDFENMHGSTLQCMATAIELSEMILICMSNSYKQSAYCRSEAEYAYTRQRHIIPLVLEKKYRPDGWLGIICASKMHVDFTKTDFEQAFSKLIAQIQLHRQSTSGNKLSSSTIKCEKKESLTHDSGTPLTVKAQENHREEDSQVQTIDRMSCIDSNYNCRYIEWWSHEDVLSFLQDKHLDVMRDLFENEQQFDGHSLYILYKQCQSNMDSTYQRLNTQLNQHYNRPLPYLTYVQFIDELRKQVNPIDIKQYIRYLFWIICIKLQQKFF